LNLKVFASHRPNVEVVFFRWFEISEITGPEKPSTMTAGNHTLQRRLTGAARAGRTNAVPIAEDLEGTSLGAAELDVPPPAYGEHHDQLQFAQAGFAADAAVTSEQNPIIPDPSLFVFAY